MIVININGPNSPVKRKRPQVRRKETNVATCYRKNTMKIQKGWWPKEV